MNQVNKRLVKGQTMKVAIIMGSKSDYPLVEKSEKILDAFGISYDTRIISAHRTPSVAEDFAKNAEDKGYEVIIAAAGKAAHLAGVVAGLTPLPVIGIPIKASALDGLDALLATVQMPKGVPVATVAIDGSENAALLAIQILSVKYPKVREAMRLYKQDMEKEVIKADAEFNSER